MPKPTAVLRRHLRNSPQAAGQVVALALMSNGVIKPCEWSELESNEVHRQLGLTQQAWRDAVGDLYLELMDHDLSPAEAAADPALIAQVLDGLTDPTLQARVLNLCMAAINADRRVDDGESAVLRAAIDLWDLDLDARELVEPLVYGLDFQVTTRRAGRL